MSWLFDRLSQLADAAKLEVTVTCADDPRVEALLTEAATLPATVVRRAALEHPDPSAAHFVAADTDASVFEQLRPESDLGVAVGAFAPNCQVTVADMDDLVSLLATLFTLRSYVNAPAT